MKVSRIIFAFILLCLFGISSVFSQGSSKKNKSKDDESVLKQIEVKANLMVLEEDNKFADIKPEDLRIYEDGVEQKITSFVRKKNALNVGLVMDNSGSMRSHLAKITAAVATFVNDLRPQDESFVVRFVASDTIEILQDWTANKQLLNSVLENLYVQGGQSAIIDALFLSGGKIIEREKADNSKRGALILITDGEERSSFYNQKELFNLLKDTDLQIFAIGLTQDLSGKKNSKTNAENLLKSLALKTGGAAFILQGKDKELENALGQSLKAISSELNSQYIIGYASTNRKRDGLARKLTVQIADSARSEKRQPFIRESFVVPEEKIK